MRWRFGIGSKEFHPNGTHEGGDSAVVTPTEKEELVGGESTPSSHGRVDGLSSNNSAIRLVCAANETANALEPPEMQVHAVINVLPKRLDNDLFDETKPEFFAVDLLRAPPLFVVVSED